MTEYTYMYVYKNNWEYTVGTALGIATCPPPP